MVRTYDEEIHTRINHLLREKTCVQMEQNRVNRIGKQWFLHKQLENQNSLGELL